MASTAYEKDRIRVTIGNKEWSDWVPKDAPQSMVMHWIAQGRERENLRDHVEEILATRFAAQKYDLDNLRGEIYELKNTLDQFINFFTQVAHSLTIATTAKSHFELENIHFDKTSNGKKLNHESEETYNLASIKHKIFKKLLNEFLPNVEHKFNLTNYLSKEK